MARRSVVSEHCGLVQVIHVRWTKASRGGEDARARAAVPAAFESPASELAIAADALFVDELHWDEQNAFAVPFSARRLRISLANGFNFGCVAITAAEEGLQVRYQYNQAKGGAPDRRFYNPVTDYGETPDRTLLVRDRQWVRVCYNGRFSCTETGNWRYEQTTINVAWFVNEPYGRIFLDQKAADELQSLANLW